MSDKITFRGLEVSPDDIPQMIRELEKIKVEIEKAANQKRLLVISNHLTVIIECPPHALYGDHIVLEDRDGDMVYIRHKDMAALAAILTQFVDESKEV